MIESYSLYELNEYIRRVIALNFNDALWVRAEIAQLDVSKQHYYINFVQKEEENKQILAYSNAVIWSSSARRLKRKLGNEFNTILQEGMEVMVFVKVDFHERYGFKLIIEDLDPTYTHGKFALQRQATLRQLQEEQLLHKNASLPFPLVVQKIAVVSSENAAGLQDYIQQLNANPYGYRFKNVLFPTAVQGIKVEHEVVQQLKKIALRKDEFDAVIIIRGGGAKLDLAGFDSYAICSIVANFPIPVLCGIGHEVDETILDLVVYESLKTPTAVAEFIINHNVFFEGRLEEMFAYIQLQLKEQLNEANFQLTQVEQNLYFEAKNKMNKERDQFNYLHQQLPFLIQQILEREQQALNYQEKTIHFLSPEATLRRGFSLTTQNGKFISSTQAIDPEQKLETIFHDGTIESEIKSIKKNTE